jgi:hypothetical protein
MTKTVEPGQPRPKTTKPVEPGQPRPKQTRQRQVELQQQRLNRTEQTKNPEGKKKNQPQKAEQNQPLTMMKQKTADGLYEKQVRGDEEAEKTRSLLDPSAQADQPCPCQRIESQPVDTYRRPDTSYEQDVRKYQRRYEPSHQL